MIVEKTWNFNVERQNDCAAGTAGDDDDCYSDVPQACIFTDAASLVDDDCFDDDLSPCNTAVASLTFSHVCETNETCAGPKSSDEGLREKLHRL